MRFKKLLAAITSAALAITTMAVAPLSVSAAAADVSDRIQFMLKLTSSGTAQAYDGAYAGGNTETSLTLNGDNITTTSEDNTGLSFSYGVGPLDSLTTKAGDVLNISVEGLTITVTDSDGSKTDTITVGNKTWNQKNEGGWWSGDVAITLTNADFTDVSDFKTNGTVTASWTSLTATMEGALPTEEWITDETAKTFSYQRRAHTDADGGDNWGGTIDGLKFDAADVGLRNDELVNIASIAAKITASDSCSVTFGAGEPTDTGWIQEDASISTGGSGESTVTLTTANGIARNENEGYDFTIKFSYVNFGTKVVVSEITVTMKDGTAHHYGDTPAEAPEDPVTVTIDPTSATVKVGETVDLTVEASDGSAVTWTSSDEAVATVSGGTVTGVSAGTATITAASGDASADCTVTVTAAEEPDDPVDTVTVTIDPTTASVRVGETVALTASASDGSDITWTSSDEAVTTVSGGTVTGVSAGTATITAASGDASATCTVTVTAAEEPDDPVDTVTVTIDPTTASVNVGETVALTASASDGSAITWTSSDEAVATVSGGTVTGVSAGTATITAASGNASATCTVTVTVAEEPPVPVEPSEPVQPTRPGSTPIPVGGGGVPSGGSETKVEGSGGASGWNDVAKEIKHADEGSEITIDMKGTTDVSKNALEEIKGKDIDLVLEMDDGITWTINGKDVERTSRVNMEVKINTSNIPEAKVEGVAGGNDVVQISLKHNGKFGFTAVMTIELGSSNDGKFANLYYYNPKTEALEYVDCGLITDGTADISFNHASDYVIVMSDNPVGDYEDVSAAAGIVSDGSEISDGFVYVCGAVVMLAVFAAALILKRRVRR